LARGGVLFAFYLAGYWRNGGKAKNSIPSGLITFQQYREIEGKRTPPRQQIVTGCFTVISIEPRLLVR